MPVSSYNIIPGESGSDAAIRRRMAYALLQRGMSPEPIQHWTQGLAKLAESALGGYDLYKLDQEDKKASAALQNLPGLGGFAADDVTGPYRGAAPRKGPDPAAIAATESPDDLGPYRSAIAGIESGGKYDALGPVTKSGDRAYGKYQVMGANVGPWTKEILGRELTPQEFAASPEAQDAVFNAKFGGYLKQYGNPGDAASMWFTGRPYAQGATRSDQLGTTGASYVQKMARALGGGPSFQVAQAAPQQQPPTISIPPEVSASIRQLLADPRTRAQGMHIYSQYAKPNSYGFQSLPDGTILRTDPRTGTVQPIYQAKTKPTYGVIGKDQFGNEQYGWIDPVSRTTSPGAGMQSSGARPSIVGPDGKLIPVPEGNDPKKFRDAVTQANADAATGKMTETQARSTTFANRMEDAEANWAKVGPAIEAGGLGVLKDRLARGVTEGAYNPIPQGATNWAVSDEFQQSEQAKSQFITAMLRQESGAAIAPSEFARYEREYFPQAGDSAKVIEQKRRARQVAIEAMKKGAGPAYKPPAAPKSAPDPLGIR